MTLIKQEDAIEAVKFLPPYREYWKGTRKVLYTKEDVIKALMALPSADRPHGEWMIDTYNMELRCEICGENFRFDNVDELLDYKEYAKYCLACGARMI